MCFVTPLVLGTPFDVSSISPILDRNSCLSHCRYADGTLNTETPRECSSYWCSARLLWSQNPRPADFVMTTFVFPIRSRWVHFLVHCLRCFCSVTCNTVLFLLTGQSLYCPIFLLNSAQLSLGFQLFSRLLCTRSALASTHCNTQQSFSVDLV